MLDVLSLQFVQHAVAAGLLAAVALGVVGTLVVVKREVFVSAGIAHASYGGVGLGFFLSLDPSLMAMVVGVALAMAMGLVRRVSSQRTDTLIGAMWAIGMASGVLLVDLTPGYTANARSFLFGSLLTVPTSDLVLIAVLDVVIVAIAVVGHRLLVAQAFDPVFVRARGLPSMVLDLLTLLLVALTVVVLMRVTGLVLLIAMLTLPAALAGRLTRTVGATMALAGAVAALCTMAGLVVSYRADVTSGPAVVGVTAAAYLLVVATTAVVGRAYRRAGAAPAHAGAAPGGDPRRPHEHVGAASPG
ncbi:metal ABC transporter permease [Pseudokineococcus sp. 5B2Z-1]|uniref:metal ABC transporter permease n=1 Tax=Pseudokineococcus sp. 5B2Z-1 TaxID=3132744 RepID=UPI0030AB4C59